MRSGEALQPGQAAGQVRIVGRRRAGADRDGVVLARSPWASARASSSVIHWLSPLWAAIRPSRVAASFSVTIGRPDAR